MAEGLLRHRAGRFFEILSAGMHPRAVDPMAVKVMSEVGVDISRQQSKGLEVISSAGRVLVLIIVCAAAEKECPADFAPAAVRVTWPLDDPAATQAAEQRLKKFREVRDQIREHIETWLRNDVPPEWLR